jgi:hypothetical protein
MAISHRTNRLKLIGTPSVEQLQNGRYKLTITCSSINSREDWYSSNKARIFPDFGSLESAEMSIDGLAPRTGEAYTDMRLTEVQSGNRSPRDGADYIVVLTYETLGDSFVQVKDDNVNYIENGLRRVTRKSIAKAGTDFQKTIGTTSITSQIDGETAVTCVLANYEVDDTDSYREVTEVYIEAGTLSETEDKVGSQLSIVKETFSSTPSTPSGYSIADERVSNFNGIPTRQFRFLKNNVTLSKTEDKVGSQLSIVKEVFNGTPSAISGYSIAKERESNVDGIPTKQFTFLKNNVQLSQSEDKVGSQLAISQQWFNPSEDKTVSGYSLASQNTSDFEGIKTIEYRFLKEDVQLSQSEDEVGSQNSITEEWFKPSASRKTKTNYSLARKDESNVQGIPTERYTFLKDNVVLSVSEDRVGSQLAITNEVFKPDDDAFGGKNISGGELSGYSEASREKSNFQGIPTLRYRFLKNNVVLSETQDKVGGQLAVVKEVFNGTPSTPSGYSVASEQESNVGGISTKKFTFLKPNILSVRQDFNNGQKRVSVQAFNKTSAEVTSALSEVTSDHKLISEQESNFAGIKTSTFEYQLDESFTEDRELNGLKRISLIELSASDFTAQTIGVVSSTAPTSGLFLGSQVIDNGGAIKIRESDWFEAGTLNVSSRNLSEGVHQVTTEFLVTEGVTVGPVISRSTSNFQGLKTISVTTLQDSSGQSIVQGGSNTVHQYNRMVDFTYPGLLSLSGDKITDSAASTNLYNFNIEPPVQAKIESKVSVIFQTSADIVADDFIFNDGSGAATGLWNPTEWASTYMSGISWNYSPFSETKGLRGYRINTTISGVTSAAGTAGGIQYLHNGVTIFTDKSASFLEKEIDTSPGSLKAAINGVSDSTGLNTIVNGKRIFASTPYRMEISGGPIDPVGVKFTLDVDLRPAFSDVDGNTYYKKTIITSTIPAQ